MFLNKIIQNYFLILFSLMPVSIVIGSSVSLFNILLIDISFVIFFFLKQNDYLFLKKDSIKYLLILYCYLILNSLISIDMSSGIYRNLGFVRIIIFFIAINFFFTQKNFFNNVFKFWLLFFLVITFDVFIEYFTGTNIMGFPEIKTGSKRIVSFFKDEPIVGGFINGFYLILIGYLLNKYYFKQKKIIFLLAIILFLAIFLTGERSNTIKAFIGIFLLIFFLKEIKLKTKIFLVLLGALSFVILVSNSDNLKMRYNHQIKSALGDQSIYLHLYKSGYQVFKNYPIFGTGNKNYRIETCNELNFDDNVNKKFKNYLCTTHPHQVYLEFLSEHGFVGTIIIFFIFYKLIFSKIFRVFNDSNYIQIGSMIFLLTTFLPILPSGAFFNDYAITIFGINLAIFYASNKKSNIFNK